MTRAGPNQTDWPEPSVWPNRRYENFVAKTRGHSASPAAIAGNQKWGAGWGGGVSRPLLAAAVVDSFCRWMLDFSETRKEATMRALYGAAFIVTVLIVAGSGQVFAGDKGGGGHVSGDGPKGNISLNYGKIENTYKPQKDDGALSAKKTGKANFNEFTIKKTSDKASPK